MRRTLLIVLILLIPTLSYVMRGQEYDIFLLIGQSNMAGQGLISDEDQGVIDKNVFLLNADGAVEPATNPLNRYSSIKKDKPSPQIGPGYSFAKKISQATGRKVLLVVNARGGSSLGEWIQGAETGYFEEAVRRTRQAIEHGGEVKAILWHQGEADCRDTTYLRRLAGFVQDLRNELGNDEIPFIAGELARWRDASKGFNQRLPKITEHISNSSYITAQDCSMLKDTKDPHFGREGQITLGERYAAKVLRMCYFEPDYSRLTAENHPRIFLCNEDFETLKKKNTEGSIVNHLHKIIMEVADTEISEGKVLKYKLDPSGRRILPISRHALKRISSCAYAYKMTGEGKYLEQVEKDINTVCAFKDWNHSHFLDVGEMAMAVAIGYDWLYNELSEESRIIARKAINQHAFGHTGESKYNRFYQARNNWNQVCNGGLVAASLATYESNPEVAARHIMDAVESNMEPLKVMYGPDGNYVEGYSYWDYGTLYQCMMLTALETAMGTDFGLSQSEGFLKTGEFMMFMEGIKESFNFYDSWGAKSPAIAMWYFADKLNKPELLFNEFKSLQEGRYSAGFAGLRLLAPVMGYAARIDLENVPAPTMTMWYGNGANPVAMIRTKWDGSDEDVYVGIKGGTASNNHSHMDAGSFVFESQGVRWACDLGNQKYAPLEIAMKKLKKSLWSRSQDSGRWDVMRYNNFHHNTITLNENKHNVKGFAPIVSVIESDVEKGVEIDMTEVLNEDSEKATRIVKLVGGKDLVVSDRIMAHKDKDVVYTWRMVGNGEPVVTKKMIILSAEGKTMYLKAKSNIKFKYRTWSAEPKAEYDDPNEGKYIVGIEAWIPMGTMADFKVVLTPDK